MIEGVAGRPLPPVTSPGTPAQLGDLRTTVNSIGPWSQTLPAADRFVVVMGGAAVLDKETGLVWEQAPDATRRAWLASSTFSNQRTLGNRRGWRLPTVQELASLMDPTASSFPKLPSGHPFGNAVQADAYWSATAHDLELTAAWFVHFGNVTPDVFVVLKTYDQLFAWCVRGGHGATDAQ